MNLSDIVILNINSSNLNISSPDYRCFISKISTSVPMCLLHNVNPNEKNETLLDIRIYDHV